jgi:hypothetical protein
MVPPVWKLGRDIFCVDAAAAVEAGAAMAVDPLVEIEHSLARVGAAPIPYRTGLLRGQQGAEIDGHQGAQGIDLLLEREGALPDVRAGQGVRG